MAVPEKMNPSAFREALPEFREKTRAFYNGEMNMKDYKGFSGKYGSYAQRGGKANMLRLRMTAGKITKEKLNFIVDMSLKHKVDLIHFTTCEAVQLHNLQPDTVFDIMDKALDVDIVCYGGGGDYPRNVMSTPLAGVDPDEYFDVTPYALAAADYLMHFIDAEKMPRKLKVAFSGSPANFAHATYRDLGFVASPNGTFDVWCAGGLGNNPRFGTRVAENVDPLDILYYIKAMILTFRKHGNYENRAKARTRYMVEKLGSPEAYRDAFLQELNAVKAEEDLRIEHLDVKEMLKTGDGSTVESSWNILPQKQDGLYTVRWHPQGGSPKLETLEKLNELFKDIAETEIRLGADETAYIVNLTGNEAKKVLEAIKDDTGASDFEASVSCIGASICQVGVRDSQSVLKSILEAVREAGVNVNALPQLHISGCPSSCGTHQTGAIGFRGTVKVIDRKAQPAFTLYVGGNDSQGAEAMGKELGVITQEDIPAFIVELGKTVEASGKDWKEWFAANPEGPAQIAQKYL